MRTELSGNLLQLCQTFGVEDLSIDIYPSCYADLTTNLACQLAKKLCLSPKDCALKLVSCLSLPPGIASAKPSPQGLINFYYTDEYKTKFIKELIQLEIPWKKTDKIISTSGLEFRIFAWKKSYTQLGLGPLFRQLKFGKTSVSQDCEQNEILQFFYLAYPPHVDLHLPVEVMCRDELSNPWYAIDYARKRNYGVIELLKDKGILEADLILFDQWPEFSSPLLTQLLRFNWQVDETRRHGRVDELFSYAKNLARTMHCYYNKVTLLNTNPIMCSANFMLLQAAQRVLTGSLKLLGVNVE